MNRVYCLYRVSDVRQVEKNDIPMQRIACQTFAKCHGWDIVKEFTEKGVSGYKRRMEERDAIQQIREDALLGKYDILLVFMFDRIGRRDDETPFMVEWLVKHGIEVWSVCEGEQRFDNHVDKLTNYIRYWQAAGESERISERTRTRIRQLTSEGVFTGGVCPYGYKLVRQGRENKKGQPLCDLVVKSDEAEVVQFIFEKTALEGYGIYRLAKLLDENGAHPKSGRPWSPTSLYGILKNPLYAGVLHKGDASSYQADLRIIDDDLFRDAQELREARVKGKAAERTVPVMKGTALLSGFLYCGTCGSRMSSNHVVRHRVHADGSITTNRTQRYYCCQRVDGVPCKCGGQHTFVAVKLEQLFLDELSKSLAPLVSCSAARLTEKRFEILDHELQYRLSEAGKQLRSATNEIDLLQREIIVCIQGASQFSHSQITGLLTKARERAKESNAEINSIHEQRSMLLQSISALQLQIEKYQRLWASFHKHTWDAKKLYYRTLSIVSKFLTAII